MHTIKTLIQAARFSRNRKGLSWGLRFVMGLFLVILFVTVFLPMFMKTVTGAESASSCSGPYLQAIGSIVADATGSGPC